MPTRSSVVLAFGVAAAACGCGGNAGPQYYPVSGVVTLADGQPASSGSVVFHAGDLTKVPAGTVEADIQTGGRFELTLPKATYKVTVQPGSTYDNAPVDRRMLDGVPPAYRKPDSTPLSAEVAGPQSGLEFRVK